MKEHRSQQHSDSPRADGSASGSARRQANAAHRPFAVFDIDGTLIRWQLYHAVVDSLVKHKYISPEAFSAIKTARLDWKHRTHAGSFKDYELELVRLYDNLLTSLSVEQFERAADDVFLEYKDQAYTYTRDLIAKLKKDGYLLFAISGSQTEVVAKIADYYGFDDFLGTVYERIGDKFSGNKEVVAFHKDQALKSLVKKHRGDYKNSIAVGDSFSDAAMLELVEQPIAFNPEHELFRYAKQRGWKIVLERKNVVYELKVQDGSYVLA
ncbi:MAG TPA: HAD family phosphatase [Candidatus Binatia bacterium]|nr:HAD family phosphatase [Candidatus Binatia bacterium]